MKKNMNTGMTENAEASPHTGSRSECCCSRWVDQCAYRMVDHLFLRFMLVSQRLEVEGDDQARMNKSPHPQSINFT